MAKANKVIDQVESKLDDIEKLVDEISLLCMDARGKIDNFKEDESNEDIEDFPELDEFNNLDEVEEKE